MSYIYVKKSSPKTTKKPFLASLFFLIGFSLLASAIFPIINFQLQYSSRFSPVVSPLSAKFYNQNSDILSEIRTDYTQLNNWFTQSSNHKNINSVLKHENSDLYHISIPILKIYGADVLIGGTNLKKSIIQYPQSALPGQVGNVVIFGHSVLPQFFNPKSYFTIFSTLFKLKQGDEIYIDFDNIKYKYLVEEMFETTPSDLSVLEQRFDGRHLTIVTCSPPGTYIRRLVIKARIVNI